MDMVAKSSLAPVPPISIHHVHSKKCDKLIIPLISVKFPTSRSLSPPPLLPPTLRKRRAVLLSVVTLSISTVTSSVSSSRASSDTKFIELPNSGGVRALDLRVGTGSIPVDGDQVAITLLWEASSKAGVAI